MQRLLAVLILTLFSAPALAQQACDVVYVVEVETASGNDVMSSKTSIFGLPYADVQDNSKRGMRVIDLASKLQDKGGPYTVELGETRACDGKPAERFAPNSIEVRGLTLAGYNKLARLALQVGGEITARYEERSGKGARDGWDHKKAKKVKRDEQGRKQQ